MRPAIEFSAKHNIKPHLTTYKLEDVPKMIELMVCFLDFITSRVVAHLRQNSHKAQGRMGVVFD